MATLVPIEVLEKIFTYLTDLSDLFSASEVCKYWKLGSQALAKKQCSAVMGPDALREMLDHASEDEDYVHALHCWIRGGTALRVLNKKNGKYICVSSFSPSLLFFSCRTELFIPLLRNRRFWSSLHGLGWIGAISQVKLKLESELTSACERIFVPAAAGRDIPIKCADWHAMINHIMHQQAPGVGGAPSRKQHLKNGTVESF